MPLATWFPEPTLIATDIGDIAIAPVTLGKLQPFARATAPLLDAIPTSNSPQQWVALMATHGDAAIEALSIATGKSRTDIESLPIDQAAQLAIAIVMVNLNFFAQRVLPSITTAVTRIQTHGTS